MKNFLENVQLVAFLEPHFSSSVNGYLLIHSLMRSTDTGFKGTALRLRFREVTEPGRLQFLP